MFVPLHIICKLSYSCSKSLRQIIPDMILMKIPLLKGIGPMECTCTLVSNNAMFIVLLSSHLSFHDGEVCWQTQQNVNGMVEYPALGLLKIYDVNAIWGFKSEELFTQHKTNVRDMLLDKQCLSGSGMECLLSHSKRSYNLSKEF